MILAIITSVHGAGMREGSSGVKRGGAEAKFIEFLIFLKNNIAFCYFSQIFFILRWGGCLYQRDPPQRDPLSSAHHWLNPEFVLFTPDMKIASLILPQVFVDEELSDLSRRVAEW